ncbi:periphilin-1-like isoform X2 [Thalassophryne amazonica]|uniref:periphilin-1-like isoform X1 n=1 Tax=Thalassophryne amazonica TaxID=390379 RepID=UPI00147264EF|nr:periphilin-1-like isoform X1 [Thalassophryne amazonica]XP_034031987.1 periphilin-1-like isoform X2 [Thalassophryne amazonica]
MAYRRGQRPIRDVYEEHFRATDSRKVTVGRTVSIYEKRSNTWSDDYDTGYHGNQWRDYSQYMDAREYSGEREYSFDDHHLLDENPGFVNFHRKSPPSRNDGFYSGYSLTQDDLRHQIDARSSNRDRPYCNRGRSLNYSSREDHNDYRRRGREPHAHGRPSQQVEVVYSRSKNRSFSPKRDKSYTLHQSQRREKPSVTTDNTASITVEDSSHSSGSSKVSASREISVQRTVDNTSSSQASLNLKDQDLSDKNVITEEKSVASVEEPEEVVAASVEPKSTPEEDIKARRLEAIKAKALEIEKHYRQDCETFRTVVKMLVAKQPSLENLLQAPLDENLLELKQHCLDALKHFVKELDQVLLSQEPSALK